MLRISAVTTLALLALVTGATRADEVLLRRYVPVDAYKGFSDDLKRGERYTYMDAEDTFLSRAKPDANFGGAATLRLDGADDAILIAFRQLNRAVPVGSPVQAVELWLTPAEGCDRDAAIAVYRVTMPWRDGHSDGRPQTFAATYNDRFAGVGEHRRPWTRPGGVADRAEQPSLTGRLADFWDDGKRAFVLTGPGLAEDVRYWLGRHLRNHGWMIVLAPDTPAARVALVSSDFFEVGDPATFTRPALRIVYELKPLATLAKPDRPDLDVTYIERTPRYTRYHDNGRTSYERKMFRKDNVGIMKYPDYADEQKWPAEGDEVTFTAHVKNAGTQPVTGPVAYCWRLNDREVARGEFTGTLAPWAEWTATWKWKWAVDHGDHRNLLLEFEVDPADRVAEITENNNVVAKYLGAKTLKYWVEQGAYEYVKDFPTALGSYSFEDYLQWHFTIWNETYFDKSRFGGVAPDGCLERTTLDDFGIVANGVLAGGIHRPYDRHDPHFDGEWGTEWDVGTRDTPEALEKAVAELAKDGRKDRETALAEARRRAQDADENDRRFLRTRRVVLEGSLLHEASHQTVGAYDVYWSNIEASEPDRPIGKCKLKDETGYYITRGSWYAYAGLMGGCDSRPGPRYWEGTGLYELNTVGGVNTNLRFRNGFYGEWQYDLPRACRVRLTSLDGRPLAGATVSLWQTSANTIDETTAVAQDVPADADGVLMLPYQDSLEDGDYTTLTGHTFRKQNPFGRPDVVGQNITLLLQVNAYGQRDYRFVRVIDFNTLFWLGQTDEATLPLACRIAPSEHMDLDRNIAAGAAVRASTGRETVAQLVDGDVKTAWDGGATKPGDWLEIELPQAARVGVIQIVQNEAHGAFYRRFAISTRAAAADSKASPFATQAPDAFSLTMSNDKDANPASPSERWVTYAATPRETRVIRIEALDGGHAKVSEIRVFAERP